MTDGFSTKISFASDPTVLFYEVGVTPPSIMGGGTNDTTNMHNTSWRTIAPKKLKSLGQAAATVHYDPAVYGDIVNLINVNNLITITFPDSTTLKFFGWLESFTPNESVEGATPTAAVVIQCSNTNASGAESAPTFATSA
jgi:hypothetical protein